MTIEVLHRDQAGRARRKVDTTTKDIRIMDMRATMAIKMGTPQVMDTDSRHMAHKGLAHDRRVQGMALRCRRIPRRREATHRMDRVAMVQVVLSGHRHLPVVVGR